MEARSSNRGDEARDRVPHDGLKAGAKLFMVFSTVGQDFDAKLCNSAQRTAKAKLRIA